MNDSQIFLISIIITVIVLVLILICLFPKIKDYDVEKGISKLQKKRKMSIRSIAYYMCNARKKLNYYKYALVFTALFIALYFVIEIPINPYIMFLFAIVFFIILIVLYLGKKESDVMIKATEQRFGIKREFLLDKLENSLNKGLLLKERHLVITNDFFINDKIIIPLDYVEHFVLKEKNKIDGTEIMLNMFTYSDVTKLEMVVHPMNGNYFSISLGSEAVELNHIKTFFEYYSKFDNQISSKYKGCQT